MASLLDAAAGRRGESSPVVTYWLAGQGSIHFERILPRI
jgi:hypothetical protein